MADAGRCGPMRDYDQEDLGHRDPWSGDGRLQGGRARVHQLQPYGPRLRRPTGNISAYLHAAAIPTWYDVEVENGEPFSQKIQQAIDECFAFVVVLSPASVASEWVLREFSRSVRKDKPRCPLLRIQCDPPIELDGVQQEDVTDGRMPSARFVARLRDLSGAAVFSDGGSGAVARHVDLRRMEILHSGPGRATAAEADVPDSRSTSWCYRRGQGRRHVRGGLTVKGGQWVSPTRQAVHGVVRCRRVTRPRTRLRCSSGRGWTNPVASQPRG
jgi:hypothetical protein